MLVTLSFLTCLVLGLAAAEDSADVLVVCPYSFREALSPWVADRESRGHRIHWISNKGSAKDIRRRIRMVAEGGSARYLVLVGDADPEMDSNVAVRRVSVPTHFEPARVNIHWGKEREIATDNWYADLDDDQLPDLAVGRIPVDSASELETVVSKVLAYERSQDYGPWRRQIRFVACPGDFGGVIDTILEQAARRITTEGIPAAYATSALYGHWKSPYCPDPRCFAQEALGALNEGGLFWVYIGHGNCRQVDRVTFPDRSEYPILRYEDIETISCQSGSPIAIFLACYTGRFDDVEDSIAEEMLRTAGAPTAIIAATRVSMPYAMTVMGHELMKGYFVHRIGTIGELVQQAKREMVVGDRNTAFARTVDALAPVLNPKSSDLAAERLEHVHLFQLIGDPTMRLRHPNEIVLEPIGTVGPGAEVLVRGHCPLDGACVVEFVPPRDKLGFKPPLRRTYSKSDALLDELNETYRRANDPVLVRREMDVAAGDFETVLQLPESHRGRGHVRVLVSGETGFGLGAAEVVVSEPDSQ